MRSAVISGSGCTISPILCKSQKQDMIQYKLYTAKFFVIN